MGFYKSVTPLFFLLCHNITIYIPKWIEMGLSDNLFGGYIMVRSELFILTENRRWRKIEKKNKTRYKSPKKKAYNLQKKLAHDRFFKIVEFDDNTPSRVCYGTPMITETGRELIWTPYRRFGEVNYVCN